MAFSSPIVVSPRKRVRAYQRCPLPGCSQRILPWKRYTSSWQSPKCSLHNGNEVFFATCARGLGPLLARELSGPRINAEILKIASSGVRFCDKVTTSRHTLSVGMRACLWARVAMRVLHELGRGRVSCPEDVYDVVRRSAPWAELIRPGGGLSVQVRLGNDRQRDPYIDIDRLSEVDVQVRAKDAVCDAVRHKGIGGTERPTRSQHAEADLPLFVTTHDGELVVYRDMAGASLHKRGYRGTAATHKAGLNECVAAAMAYAAGIGIDGTLRDESRGYVSVVDPMCGAGTTIIEAGLLVRQVAVGLFRKQFAFERWSDFDKNAMQEMVTEAIDIANEKKKRPLALLGGDVHEGAIRLAKQGRRGAHLERVMMLRNCDIRHLELKERPHIVLCNPPWGRRLPGEEESWDLLGDFLRKNAEGSTAVLLSGDRDASKALRMRARKKDPVRIGNVDTRILTYDVLSHAQVLELIAKQKRNRKKAATV